MANNQAKITELEKEIAKWEQHDYERSMSDDFWYSNGGHGHAVAEITKLKKQIAELK